MAIHGAKKSTKIDQTLSCARRDFFQSSDYSSVKAFVPSYERKCEEPNMAYIMSMEYARIWKEEKDEYWMVLRQGNEDRKKRLKGYAQNVIQNVRSPVKANVAPKRTKLYDHVQSKYLQYTNPPKRYPCS